MKKKIIAALLAATMVAAAVPVYAADDAAADTATESTTESPLNTLCICHLQQSSRCGRIHLPQQQRSLAWKQALSSAMIMRIHGRVQLNSARRVAMMD